MQSNDDVTDEILDFIKKAQRRCRYEKRKEIDNGVVYFETECDIERVAYQRWLQDEQALRSFDSLYNALDDLKKIDSAGYKLIMEFYFCEGKTTYSALAKKHGITGWAVSKKIKKCLAIMKILVELHDAEK